MYDADNFEIYYVAIKNNATKHREYFKPYILVLLDLA